MAFFVTVMLGEKFIPNEAYAEFREAQEEEHKFNESRFDTPERFFCVNNVERNGSLGWNFGEY